MDKFSKLRPNKYKDFDNGNPDNDVLYSDSSLSIVKSDGWSIVKEKDVVVCIPYLIEQNKFILRQEYIPTFKYVDDQDYHIALVGGQVEKGEDVEVALLRELEEEAGIVLRENYQIEIDKPLFFNKGNTSKVYTCILNLTENDYHEVIVNDPDNANKKHKNVAVKVDVKYINSINCSDLVSQYMIDKLKKYLNI